MASEDNVTSVIGNIQSQARSSARQAEGFARTAINIPGSPFQEAADLEPFPVEVLDIALILPCTIQRSRMSMSRHFPLTSTSGTA